MTHSGSGGSQSAGDADPIGGTIVDDRFEIEELLGEGGVGRVYRATQLSVGRDVAIKVLRGNFRRNEEYRQRFLREARVISGFNHPNIVRLIDFGNVEGDFSYLVMEMVDGVELADLLDDARLEQRFAAEVVYQAAGALVEAHASDVIHRDLKTENILLVPMSTGGFQAKVLDFGVAFPTDSETRLTSDGEVFGTPAYMAPEQGKGEYVGKRADLYSLGVILFEMVAGRLPFEADSTLEMMVKRIEEEPPRLADETSFELAPGLSRLVGDLLARDPDSRPPDAQQVRARIDDIRDRANWDDIRLDPNDPMERAFEAFAVGVDYETSESNGSGGLSSEQMEDLVPEDGTDLDPSFAEAITGGATEITQGPPLALREEDDGGDEQQRRPPLEALASGGVEASEASREVPADGTPGSGEIRAGDEPSSASATSEERAASSPSRPGDAAGSASASHRTSSADASVDTGAVEASDVSDFRSALDEAGSEDELDFEGWALWGTIVMFGLTAFLAVAIMVVQSGGGDGGAEATASDGAPARAEEGGGTPGVAAGRSEDAGGDVGGREGSGSRGRSALQQMTDTSAGTADGGGNRVD